MTAINFISSSSRTIRSNMTSSASNRPDNPTVLGFGGVSVDLLATVASFPNPDDKIRSTSMKKLTPLKSPPLIRISISTVKHSRIRCFSYPNMDQCRYVKLTLKPDGTKQAELWPNETQDSPRPEPYKMDWVWTTQDLKALEVVVEAIIGIVIMACFK